MGGDLDPLVTQAEPYHPSLSRLLSGEHAQAAGCGSDGAPWPSETSPNVLGPDIEEADGCFVLVAACFGGKRG